MRVVERPDEMQAVADEWRAGGLTVGLVPTMGALHEGHLSLMRAARDECDRVAASIFVNPTQFGQGEDYDTYARPFERDASLLEQEGCDLIFAPGVEDMYSGASLDLSPDGERVYVEPARLGGIWEGEARPGHMRGVATVVAMLLNIARPHRAYFGEKDYQQLKLIERMAQDLFFGVEIVPCPTKREPDGLAISSRNANLSPQEREAALALSRALRVALDLAAAGERDAVRLVAEMRRVCEDQTLVDLRYAAVVDAETLAPLQTVDGSARALISANVGATHLIDNAAL
jgi:pantoate--beta-alanine ligase